MTAYAVTIYVPLDAAPMVGLILRNEYDGYTHWRASGMWRGMAEDIECFRVVVKDYNKSFWDALAQTIRTGFDQHEVMFDVMPCLMVLVTEPNGKPV